MLAIHHELLVMMRLHQQQYGMGNAEALVAAMHQHVLKSVAPKAVEPEPVAVEPVAAVVEPAHVETPAA